MPFGVIKFSHEARQILLKIYTLLSLLLFIISAALIVNSFYINATVAPSLSQEKVIIRLIFVVIGMLATQLAIFYIAGICICNKCHIEAYKKHSRYLLRIWNFTGYTSILNVLVLSSMTVGVSNHIMHSMHLSMVQGMKSYLTDMEWKENIDQLQFKYQCCGSRTYTDWFEIPWLNIYHIITDSELIENNTVVAGEQVTLKAVPWSCCRLDFPSQCFHDPLQQYQYTHNWPTLTSDSLNNIGCIEKLREPLENSFLVFILASYLILLLQILLSIVSRYLYTSFKNSVILGDPFGRAPGWLCGDIFRSDSGLVLEDMYKPEVSTTITDDDYKIETEEEKLMIK